MIDVRRADTRAHTKIDWLDSHHSFSFGPHYDPNNTHHGLLLVSNDDRVKAGTGFGTHAHQDMEIVTWVLEGRLEHNDSEGNHGELYPGLAQRMSAGTGIRHSEQNPSPVEDVHFIQMWVPPDTEGHRARLRAARHQRRARQGRPTPDRVRARARRGDRAPPARRGALGRTAAAGETVSVPDGPSRARVRRDRCRRPREARARCVEGDAARLGRRGHAGAHRRPRRCRSPDLGDRLDVGSALSGRTRFLTGRSRSRSRA